MILLNGPPASGKSTIAERFVASRPLALNLDVDVVRALLGGWLDDAHNAGLAARRLALAMASTHLAEGRDVVVPQFLGRVDFVEQLASVADRADATFVEVVLSMSRDEAVAAFEARRAAPTTDVHLDATALVERMSGDDPVGRMYDACVGLVEQRPATRRVEVVRGDIDGTFARFLDAVGVVE